VGVLLGERFVRGHPIRWLVLDRLVLDRLVGWALGTLPEREIGNVRVQVGACARSTCRYLISLPELRIVVVRVGELDGQDDADDEQYGTEADEAGEQLDLALVVLLPQPAQVEISTEGDSVLLVLAVQTA